MCDERDGEGKPRSRFCREEPDLIVGGTRPSAQRGRDDASAARAPTTEAHASNKREQQSYQRSRLRRRNRCCTKRFSRPPLVPASARLHIIVCQCCHFIRKAKKALSQSHGFARRYKLPI